VEAADKNAAFRKPPGFDQKLNEIKKRIAKTGSMTSYANSNNTKYSAYGKGETT
jgi:hypothetical protein